MTPPTPLVLTFTPSLNKLLMDNWVPFDSDEALIYLTPVLGPTSTLLIHRLARYVYNAGDADVTAMFEVVPQPFTIEPVELAGCFGISEVQLARSIERLTMFRALAKTPYDGQYAVPRGMTLRDQWVMRMPAMLHACPYVA